MVFGTREGRRVSGAARRTSTKAYLVRRLFWRAAALLSVFGGRSLSSEDCE